MTAGLVLRVKRAGPDSSHRSPLSESDTLREWEYFMMRRVGGGGGGRSFSGAAGDALANLFLASVSTEGADCLGPGGGN